MTLKGIKVLLYLTNKLQNKKFTNEACVHNALALSSLTGLANK